MKRLLICALMIAGLAGCVEDENASNKSVQAQRAKEAANSINFVENAEIDNIKRRLELTSKPDALGYILLINEMGQPVMYTGVRGKVTSGSKRLTEADRCVSNGNGGCVTRAAASDEGTYGSSGEYIFFWNTDGQYIQWNGKYMYSDKPLRLKVEPIVVLTK